MAKPRKSSQATPRRKHSIKSIVLFSAISLVVLAAGFVTWVYVDNLPPERTHTYVNEFGIPITIEEVDRDWNNVVIKQRPSYTLAEVGEIPDPIVEVHDSKWLERNLYKVDSYIEQEDGMYSVALVNIEPAAVYSFDDLREIFLMTSYSNENSYALVNGVNCQGMTCYIADWCEKNDHEYAIEYFKSHVAIRVLHRDKWYRFNFVNSPSITLLDE